MKFILWLYFCPKRGCNSHYIHVLLCKYSCHIGTLSIFVTKGGVTLTIFMYYYANIHPILELWVHKSAKWWIVVNSGRWYRSCNWGNPFWVKLTSSFYPVSLCQFTWKVTLDMLPIREVLKSELTLLWQQQFACITLFKAIVNLRKQTIVFHMPHY